MAKICLCLTGKTIEENLEIVQRYRDAADVVELRADLLNVEERYSIRRFPGLCPLPSILTVRRTVDGGAWNEGEGGRLVVLSNGIAFADPDPRKNFAYVDLEKDLHVASVEEAARAFGIRIIRSFHDIQGMPENPARVLSSLCRHPDEIPKLAVRPRSLRDAMALLEVAEAQPETGNRIILGMGPYGFFSRLLPGRFRSFLSYASPLREGKTSAAAGQVDPRTLIEGYRFRQLDEGAEILGFASRDALESAIPLRVNGLLASSGINAALVPITADALPDVLELSRRLGVKGLALGSPFRTDAAGFCASLDPTFRLSGIVSVMLKEEGGWKGFDADSRAMLMAMRDFLGGRPIFGRRAAVVGRGAMARAAVFSLRKLGGRIVVTERAAAFSADGHRYPSVRWSGPAEEGLRGFLGRPSLIVKVSFDKDGADRDDPLPFLGFTGKESVMDLGRWGGASKFAARAWAAGCRTADGSRYEELRAQEYARILKGEGEAWK